MRSMVELLNQSPSDHGRNSGPRYSIERPMPAQGFTAVNGLDGRPPAISESSMGLSTESSNRPNNNVPSAEPVRESMPPSRQTSMRNDSVLCPEPAIKLSPDTAKRKRLMTENVEYSHRDSPATAVALSPKRRMTETRNSFHSNTPTGSTLNLLNTHVSIEHNIRDRCSRERSPIPTRDQREAPPQVRPETEAHLAESLATHLQDVSNQAPNDGARATESAQVTHDAPTSRYEESPVEGYSPGADPSDPHSKRKRNFSNRTKTGCHTCRTRKKKCDEAKPECNNCLRGGFTCTGYGPKPIESHKGSNANNRAQVPLQSKIQDAPQRSPAPLSSDGPRYDHWGRIPPAPTAQESHHRLPPAQSSRETRYPHSRDDVWRNSSWQYREPESPIYHNNTFPPPDYHQSMPPASTFDSRPAQDIWRHNIHSSHFPSAPANISSNEPSSAHSSRNPPFAPMQSSEVTEKHKMLIGEPYKAHIDGELLEDRRSCMAAVERWNQAHQHSRATSDEEKGRLFKAILDPSQRPDPNYQYRETSASLTRPGTIGSRVIIVSPFTCDYGYNIHIGDDSFLGANCTIEDAGDISIGSRVHIGKNVIFCGTDEPILRKGSQSELTAGAITIEDEVNIGAGTIIMPHRTIGKGASIAAGSVVTRNIPSYTIAAGNPCRVIRSLPRPDSPESKRHSRELTAFTTHSGSVGSGMGIGSVIGSLSSEEELVGDKQLMLENDQSLREMRARRGIREGSRR